MNSSTRAQIEQNQPKTINDLHTAFTRLEASYNNACKSRQLSDLAILEADCSLMAIIANVLKASAKTSDEQATPTLENTPEGNAAAASVLAVIYEIDTVQGQYSRQQNPKINAIIEQQNQERGLEPMPLEVDLLHKRVSDGGHSGQFLADALISAYRIGKPFNHSLGEVVQLDAEAFRLFHQILHIRHIRGWNDENLYQVEQQVIAIVGGAV